MDPVSAVAGLAETLISRIWPDPAARASAEAQLIKAQMDAALAGVQQQIDINKVEAASSSVFVAGWRPGIGWICGAAFGLHFVVLPMLGWLAVLFGHAPIAVPFDMDTLMTVLMGMLGLGGLRTFEKVRGVASR
jgi:hypothetical protein